MNIALISINLSIYTVKTMILYILLDYFCRPYYLPEQKALLHPEMKALFIAFCIFVLLYIYCICLFALCFFVLVLIVLPCVFKTQKNAFTLVHLMS